VRSVDKCLLTHGTLSTKQEFIVLVTISQKCDKTKATHNSKLFFNTINGVINDHLTDLRSVDKKRLP
jgi:hypothetical protein